MASESKDVRHAISMRPHPFHTDPHSNSHSRTGSPATSNAKLENPSQGRARRDEYIPLTSPYRHEQEQDDAAPNASSRSLHSTSKSPQVSTKSPLVGHSTAYEHSIHDGEERHDPVSRQPHGRPSDEEEQRTVQYNQDNDPYGLAKSMKTASEIEMIKANTSRKREAREKASTTSSLSCGFPLYTNGKNALHAKKIQTFYEEQNENIERLLKPVDDHRREAKDSQADTQVKYKIAVIGSFVANVCLAILQVYGAVTSGSLALFTTMADALFDPLSNLCLILCNRAVKRVDARRYPSGKARIETAGNISFCFLMVSVSLIIVVQSCIELTDGAKNPSTPQHRPFYLASTVAVAVAFVTKLALFLYCYALRNLYSQIRILWEDHRNDLIINGIGLAFSLMGSFVRWWIDPMGAIVLSLVIIALWLRTAYSEFLLLVGVTADTGMLQLITYVAMTHSPSISQIDTVRAYHSGPRLIVEVDVVMSPFDSLRHTHDTAEALQIKLESLPHVERAYVHVDYETEHKPEHVLKKEL